MRLPAALLLPLVLVAQTPPENLCTVSGTVVNAATAEPVRRALLTLRRIDSSPAVTNIRTTNAISTDTAGHFTITGIQPGTYRLTAEHTGFIPAQSGARGPGKTGAALTLEPGQKSTGLLLNLYPHGVIAGRIIDEDGEAVQGVDVQVSRLQYLQGRKQLVRSSNAVTNDLGEYRVFGLAPGRYFVNAVYRPNPNASDAAAAAGEGEYVPTFYPHTTDAASAASLDLSPGAQLRNIDITLARVRTVTIKGKVENEIPLPASALGDAVKRSNLAVLLSAQNPMIAGGVNSRGGYVSPEGDFEFRSVAPGSYLLVAMVSVPSKAYTTRLPLQVGASNIEGVTIAIHAPVSVAGRVRIDGETTSNLTGIRVGLAPFDASGTVFGLMPDVALKPDGSFQLADVSAEHYRLSINGLPDGFYVKSIRAANVDVQLAGLDLNAGTTAPLQIVLSPNAGQLTGTVLDPKNQKPVSAVTVVLVPQEKERRDRESFYKVAATDAAGHFTVKNLVPGDYKVYSWEDVPFGSWMDPEFLLLHEARGEPVTIREGSPQSIQVTLTVE